MPWYAVYESATGRLESIGEIIADPLRPDLQAKLIDAPPDWDLVEWDATLLDFVPRPPKPVKNLIEIVLSHAKIAPLPERTKATIRDVLSDIFGVR